MTNSPVYLRILKEIKEKINSSVLKPGDILPAKSSLSQQYGVSRATVRNGLALLVVEQKFFDIVNKPIWLWISRRNFGAAKYRSRK
ncbi:GntR family transcriptional regulator [Desulfitobacterium metallireducens]|uniref:HTH gntR-type domain-containing protein n=1 Tax=Desulfitobacterium metallireducens DSM 15288 TaxID=871968 RepID=W0ECD9_9FIRM|nr:GntR family transcriptional regulator [Desulfitobacterium metallireducens]AHF08550.1 hypothetical protein DESME_08775 [Desulfitobacterium metallireducens DSM 15288]